MSQVTWRASDDLVAQVKAVAAGEGRSLNDYLTRIVSAAVDPEAADSGIARIRERLARAGVLAEVGPPKVRPDAEAVARARRAVAGGRSASSYVSDGRE